MNDQVVLTTMSATVRHRDALVRRGCLLFVISRAYLNGMALASHMREARRVIHELASMGPNGPPFVSLYLDAKWSDEHQRERARLFLQRRARDLREEWMGMPDGEDAIRSLDSAMQWITQDIIEQGDPAESRWDGFALFVSRGRDRWVAFRARVPIETELEIEEQPRLLQIAKVLSDHAPAFVVLLDGRWIRIFEVALGAVLVEVDLEQYLPGRVDSGDRGPFAKRFSTRVGPAALARGDGLSQMRFQRHIRDHLEHNLKTAAELLERLSGHEGQAPVVLCGEDELRGLFRRLMSGELRGRIAHESRLDSKAPRHRAVDMAVKALNEATSQRRRQEIGSVLGRALGSGSSAVLGTEDTMLALNQSRLHTLYIDDSSGVGRGWKCTSCAAFGHKAEIGCPFCRGRTETVDLLQEMTRRALASETRVVTVSGHPRLRHYRGMAGTLRRGLSPPSPRVGHVSHEPLPPV